MTPKDFKYTHYMTLKEWEEWEVNFTKHYKGTDISKDYMLDNERNFERIISASFLWKSTPQGFDYWNKISQRTKPVN